MHVDQGDWKVTYLALIEDSAYTVEHVEGRDDMALHEDADKH